MSAMMEGQMIVQAASDQLRAASESDEGAAAVAAMVAAVMSMIEPKRDDGKCTETRLRELMLRAAELLSPICPHCGKHLR